MRSHIPNTTNAHKFKSIEHAARILGIVAFIARLLCRNYLPVSWSITQDAFTGWLWKPGTPTGEASELLTKDGEWFSMRVKAVGNKITIWVNEVEVMNHQDDEYKKGHFALQCHNAQMTIEAKDLYYRELSDS